MYIILDVFIFKKSSFLLRVSLETFFDISLELHAYRQADEQTGERQ